MEQHSTGDRTTFQLWNPIQHFRSGKGPTVEDPSPLGKTAVAVAGEKVVDLERQSEGRRLGGAPEEGHDDGQWLHEVWGDAQPGRALTDGVPHPGHVEVLKMAQPTMDDFETVGGRPTREVVSLQ
jgi:hypothetical protein